mgnify:CR=1 FL=1
MTKTISILFSVLLLTSLLYGGDNFSEMSTQELISIIGYVKQSDVEKFKKELESRLPDMSAAEKKAYNDNLKKLK